MRAPGTPARPTNDSHPPFRAIGRSEGAERQQNTPLQGRTSAQHRSSQARSAAQCAGMAREAMDREGGSKSSRLPRRARRRVRCAEPTFLAAPPNKTVPWYRTGWRRLTSALACRPPNLAQLAAALLHPSLTHKHTPLTHKHTDQGAASCHPPTAAGSRRASRRWPSAARPHARQPVSTPQVSQTGRLAMKSGPACSVHGKCKCGSVTRLGWRQPQQHMQRRYHS